MKRKNGIDLFRFIGAFFIMLVHTKYGYLPEEYVDNIRISARWAVPFFFLCSGYFLQSKITDNKILDFRKIEKNIVNLISIIIVASFVYLLVNRSFTLEVSSILTGTYFHLWFIGSLIFGYLFLWYIYYIKRTRLLPLISSLILLSALFSDSYDVTMGINLDYYTFGFFISIPFLYFGLVISRFKFSKTQTQIIFIIFILSFALQYIESNQLFKHYFYPKYDHQLLIGTIISSVSLFILTTKINIQNNRLSDWGKDYSLFIYLYHPFIYYLINTGFGKTLPNAFGYLSIFNPILGFTISLLGAIFIEKYFNSLFNLLNGRFLQKQ
ncbi:MAG: acyltransferase [Bacteroidales bacterium]|nr:acyltransferase [Bacteroidales bacterium]